MLESQSILSTAATGGASSNETPLTQLNKYISEVEEHKDEQSDSPLVFWAKRKHVYGLIANLAEDLLAAPASQAYVERIFSVCGILTNGRRNRMSASLQMRACLKLNHRVLSDE